MKVRQQSTVSVFEFGMCCQTGRVNLQRSTCTYCLVILSLTVHAIQCGEISVDAANSSPVCFRMYDLGCRENGALKLIFVDNLIVFWDRA